MVVRWLASWLLSSIGEDAWWSTDETVLPPEIVTPGTALGRELIVPLLVGAMCVVGLSSVVRPPRLAVWIGIALVVVVPLAWELGSLLFTSDAAYHEALWHLYARTDGGLDYGGNEIGASIEGLRWTGLGTFFFARLMQLPFDVLATAIGAWLTMGVQRLVRGRVSTAVA